MPYIDVILVILLVGAAALYLGRHYYRKWKAPKGCGSGNCGCAGSNVKFLSSGKRRS